MFDASEIKAAVGLLDQGNDAHWEADGTPKLSALRELLKNDKLTEDDVDDAIGAYKRLEVKGAAQAPTPAEQGAASVPLAPAVEELHPLDPSTAEAQLADATRKRDALVGEISKVEKVRDEAQAKISSLQALVDCEIVRIETYSPRVTHAQAVKAIQRQTVETLARNKGVLVTAATALRGAGVNATIYPSKLDEARATQRRTPEQVQNMAKFVEGRVRDVADRAKVQ